jgi:hypothetical protein
MKRKRADALIVDTTLRSASNGHRSITPENIVSISWDDVIEAFTNEFHSLREVQVRNRKVHLDFCQEECKTIDGPNDNWISMLIIDALIYYVNNDTTKRVRRSFNQHQVLADAIWKCYKDKIRNVNKGPIDPISSSSSSFVSSSSVGSSRMTRQRISANITENFEYRFKLLVTPPWVSFNDLKETLQRSAPRKPGRRYTNSVRYYCSHPILRQHRYESLRHLICYVVKEVLQSRHNTLYHSTCKFQLVITPDADTCPTRNSSNNRTRESMAISPDDPSMAFIFNEFPTDDKHDHLFHEGLGLFSESTDSFITSGNELFSSLDRRTTSNTSNTSVMWTRSSSSESKSSESKNSAGSAGATTRSKSKK